MWPRTFCIIHNFSFFVDGSNRSNLWTAHDPLPDNDRQYGFTLFSMSLNEKNDSKKEREGGRGTYIVVVHVLHTCNTYFSRM